MSTARALFLLACLALLAAPSGCNRGPAEGTTREVLETWPQRGRRDPVVRVRGKEVRRGGKWVKEGEFVFYDERGRIIGRGRYEEGLEQGPWELLEGGEITARGSFQAGRREGHWTYTYPNGQLQEEGAYVAGQREGQWQRWYEDGTLAAELMYHEGEKHGPCRFWDEKGKLDTLRSGRYAEGQRIE